MATSSISYCHLGNIQSIFWGCSHNFLPNNNSKLTVKHTYSYVSSIGREKNMSHLKMSAAMVDNTERPLANFHSSVWEDYFLSYTPQLTLEQQRKHIASFIECSMKELGGSKQDAYAEAQKKITNAWKDMNKDFLCSTHDKVPTFVLELVINIARLANLKRFCCCLLNLSMFEDNLEHNLV
uniref:Terpene synthase metal-binding domain-containing protein n=1 Tax=Nicotiana tabacum TaxID=4097 RepID=A0A1S3Y5B1_TOBAC|nr:PREDICTED: uncharacterized protein LOC107772284 [Nicotiana tabacum]